MALVADYESSGEEEDMSEEDSPPQPSSMLTPSRLVENKSVVSNSSSVVSSPSTVSKSQNPKSFNPFFEEEDPDDGGGTSSLGQFLPKPKTASDFPPKIGEECGPIPPKKTYGDEEMMPPPQPNSFPNLMTKKVKGVVRIKAPSLKDFENDVVDDKSKSQKFVQSMIKKGSGLFAILPEPKGGSFSFSRDVPTSFLKNKTTNSPVVPPPPDPIPVETAGTFVTSTVASSSKSLPRSLIPDSVKNAGKRPPPSKLEEIKTKYLKQDANVVIVSRGRNQNATKVQDIENDSDEESSSTPTSSFFSFDSGADEIDEETLEKLKLPMPDFTQLPLPSSSRFDESLEEDSISDQEAVNDTRQQDFMKYVPKKKGKATEINFIDVNADDLRPDSNEWVKNLTDDSAIPVRRGKGLGGMQKRKHQITYLAVEAKAREQELQQQWAAGRANRRQTKMKYGF